MKITVTIWSESNTPGYPDEEDNWFYQLEQHMKDGSVKSMGTTNGPFLAIEDVMDEIAEYDPHLG